MYLISNVTGMMGCIAASSFYAFRFYKIFLDIDLSLREWLRCSPLKLRSPHLSAVTTKCLYLNFNLLFVILPEVNFNIAKLLWSPSIVNHQWRLIYHCIPWFSFFSLKFFHLQFVSLILNL